MSKTTIRPGQLSPSMATEAEVEIDIRAVIGVPDGVAPLDSTGKVPMSNLPQTALTTLMETLDIDGGVF